MKRYQQGLEFVCLSLVLWTAAGQLAAQDEKPNTKPPTNATAKPYDSKSGGTTAQQIEVENVEEERQRIIRADYELRSRLDDTVWNDLDIRAGKPGQVWMFRPAVQRGKRTVREWYLNDDVGLPLVGTWEVNKSEIVLYALDGTLIGRGKYAEDEIVGRFIDPDRRQDFGQFRLREETKRNYRVLPLRVTKRTLGK